MTARSITLLGFAAIVAAGGLGAVMTSQRAALPSPADIVVGLTRTRGRRLLVVLLWAVIGWHLFVRGSGAFE